MTDAAWQVAAAKSLVDSTGNSNNRTRIATSGGHAATREDAIALGPEQAHRTIAVLEDAAEKLGFLGSIMPDVLQHRDELSKFVGDEISRIIQVSC